MIEEGQVIEGYTIVKTLGSGGMSQVYLASDNKDVYYAIKELADFSSAIEKDVALKSFYKEINILKEY